MAVRRPTSTPRAGWLRALLREARSVPTLLLAAGILIVGLPLVVVLTPPQHVRVFGQDIALSARPPDPSLSGPAQLVQLGNTRFDLRDIQVHGPLRPRLALGPIQRGPAAAAALSPDSPQPTRSSIVDTLVRGFVTWYLWGLLGMVLVALAGSGIAGCLRILLALRRDAREEPVRINELARRYAGTIGRMTVVAVVVALGAWGASGAAAYRGTTRGLAHVHSLNDLVGVAHVTPAPIGPPVVGYTGAVIGDSRVARVGGPPAPNPSAVDTACGRSADSAAAELGLLRNTRVLNLACSGASIADGLIGPQKHGDVTVPPQVGRLEQVSGLDWVVVAIGPNDLAWSDFLRYCYGMSTCDDRLSAGELALRLAAFDHDYGALLADLAALPGSPQVVVMTSYDPFPTHPDPACPDMRGPAGVPGLDAHKVDLLVDDNAQLNRVLSTGAEKYGFTVAQPALTPLCTPDRDGMGSDLQGLSDPFPFHPTAVGELRLAAALAAALPAGP
ncbi:GDSL-type esterase/lipase family protein [Pseudonocardia sp. RS11V-5]|uniref:GDSL-type esterase/lipase family protein n=1 Tax=Pseudonocardia terrae TaxID=2905831 RepID=UPI001E653956|nr:GDSL-type esterase/lipase family protein [Pseudonocardia terrae]MCE3553176.1 GDSL-type esterase/lipase family protein [Pseudonocardia terrae]